ncbi:MAG: di-heme oxidoredictase family protein [Planctomycetota bacterium]|jgi:CxxC motif-containing protein (DUF1111 family)
MRLFVPAVALACLACGASCSGTSPPQVERALGDPNPGLSAAELDAFERGRGQFERRFNRSEGHGPDFNTSSCRSCHSMPVTGGSSSLYRNFFVVGYMVLGRLEPGLDEGQFVARSFSYARTAREAIPADADVVAQRNAPPTFGMGLLERIPDAEIRANEDPIDLDGDGISGRVNQESSEIGRFGYKAQESDLEAFVRGPLFNHMGITTDPLSFGPRVAGTATLAQVSAPAEPTTDLDGVPDPELSFTELSDLLVFVRELGPPPPEPMDFAAQRGERIFAELRCANCHIPNLVQNGEPVLAYSDLLLHDMGPELADGIDMDLATGSEFRTQPLWGLRHHAPYLHDGRADTIEGAILLHGGEAQRSRDGFAALRDADRAALIAFLETR